MEELMAYLLPGVNAIVIRKGTDSRLFLTTPDSFIIKREVLIQLVRVLVMNGLIEHEILEGILEEVHLA